MRLTSVGLFVDTVADECARERRLGIGPGRNEIEALVESYFVILGWPAADVACRVGSRVDETPVVYVEIVEDSNLDFNDGYGIARHALGHSKIDLVVHLDGLTLDEPVDERERPCVACSADVADVRVAS